MAAKTKTAARKAPSQARSQATVDAILDGTARVLVASGYDRASTNRIAAAAGVSVGSLYQYCPSKEALVGALIDRHQAEMMGVFLKQVERTQAAPVREAVRAVVTATVDAHHVDPKLHRILGEQVPRVGRLAQQMEQLDTHAAVVVRAYLEAHQGELRVRDLDTATFVVVHAVESLVHRAIASPREIGREALVDALVDLVVRYLTDERESRARFTG